MADKKTTKNGNYQQLREQLFEVEIKPLIDNLAAKCNEYNFAMYSSILILNDGDEATTNVSIVNAEDMPRVMQFCALLTRDPKLSHSVVQLIAEASNVTEKIDAIVGKDITTKGGNHEPES